MLKLKKIKHSSVTNDFIAAEENQNQNWQYYIEQHLQFCHNKQIGKAIRKPQPKFLVDTAENISTAKKSYETFIIPLNKVFV